MTQPQPIADPILSAALQAGRIMDDLDMIYAVAIAWADKASLHAVFAFNEITLDRQQTEYSRQQIPARLSAHAQ